jgi:hypothetical protein
MKFDRVDCGSIFLWPILQARNTRSLGMRQVLVQAQPRQAPARRNCCSIAGALASGRTSKGSMSK